MWNGVVTRSLPFFIGHRIYIRTCGYLYCIGESKCPYCWIWPMYEPSRNDK